MSVSLPVFALGMCLSACCATLAPHWLRGSPSTRKISVSYPYKLRFLDDGYRATRSPPTCGSGSGVPLWFVGWQAVSVSTWLCRRPRRLSAPRLCGPLSPLAYGLPSDHIALIHQGEASRRPYRGLVIDRCIQPNSD